MFALHLSEGPCGGNCTCIGKARTKTCVSPRVVFGTVCVYFVLFLLQYDEYVPDDYEPQLGGFYINDGELYFKIVTSDDDDSRSLQMKDDK